MRKGTTVLKHPSAFLPVATTLGALEAALVLLASHHPAPSASGGLQLSHIWHLLMAGQIPIVLLFSIKWVPRSPRQAVRVLALHAGAALAAMAQSSRCIGSASNDHRPAGRGTTGSGRRTGTAVLPGCLGFDIGWIHSGKSSARSPGETWPSSSEDDKNLLSLRLLGLRGRHRGHLRGAPIIRFEDREPLEKKPWGLRQFTVQDLDGNRFYFHCD